MSGHSVVTNIALKINMSIFRVDSVKEFAAAKCVSWPNCFLPPGITVKLGKNMC